MTSNFELSYISLEIVFYERWYHQKPLKISINTAIKSIFSDKLYRWAQRKRKRQRSGQIETAAKIEARIPTLEAEPYRNHTQHAIIIHKTILMFRFLFFTVPVHDIVSTSLFIWEVFLLISIVWTTFLEPWREQNPEKKSSLQNEWAAASNSKESPESKTSCAVFFKGLKNV